MVRAVLQGDEAAMGEDAALGRRYAILVLAHDPLAEELRTRIVERWGEPALVSLAMVIAGTRVYPTLKYALGYGHACSRVRAGGVDVVPRREAGLHPELAAA